ncbi:MAG: DNA polymerase III subunit alpha, partial [Anaerotignum sp.]|nr:DNA polymerase III subunit alpha [Anaerotignum sp.]
FRSQYMTIYKNILDGIGQARKNNIEGQLNLFDLGGSDDVFQQKDELPDIPEYSPRDKLAMEKEVLGIYVSGHPLAEYEEVLRRKISHTSLDFIPPEEDEDRLQVEEETKVIVGGMVAGISVKYTRNNDKMAFLTLEDFQGSMEVILFPKVYEKCAAFLREEEAYIVKGRANVSADGEGKVSARAVRPLALGEKNLPNPYG